MPMGRIILSVACVVASTLAAAATDKKYDGGATDTEIRIGNLAPYSGPFSAYSALAKAQEAYFHKINDEGGIHGRRIKFISYDDASSPPKTVEQVRKLVESDDVLAVLGPLGTPSNTAMQKYLNASKVPQIFVGSGAAKWADPQNFPWTMGMLPSYRGEGHIYAAYLLKQRPEAKVGILYENNDYGRDYVKGFKDGLGNAAKDMIVAEVPYETSQPTIDSQIATLKASGADTLFSVTSARFASQTIRKLAELNWKPRILLNGISTSISAVLEPAGLENAKDIVSAASLKDPTDPQWTDDPETRDYLTFLEKYDPGANKADAIVTAGYVAAQLMVQVLRQCGDDLRRENVMKQAANLRDFRAAMLLPGIMVNTSSSDYRPIEGMQLVKFDGTRWVPFGPILNSESGLPQP